MRVQPQARLMCASRGDIPPLDSVVQRFAHSFIRVRTTRCGFPADGGPIPADAYMPVVLPLSSLFTFACSASSPAPLREAGKVRLQMAGSDTRDSPFRQAGSCCRASVSIPPTSSVTGRFFSWISTNCDEKGTHELHCHWTAIATNPIGQRVPVQTRGILQRPEEQSRPRGGKSIGVTDQPQYPRL